MFQAEASLLRFSGTKVFRTKTEPPPDFHSVFLQECEIGWTAFEVSHGHSSTAERLESC